MKRFIVLGTTLALAVAATPAAAKNTGTPDGGGPPFVTGQPNGTVVFHCKAIGGHGTVVVQEKRDPDRVIGSCTFPE